MINVNKLIGLMKLEKPASVPVSFAPHSAILRLPAVSSWAPPQSSSGAGRSNTRGLCVFYTPNTSKCIFPHLLAYFGVIDNNFLL